MRKICVALDIMYLEIVLLSKKQQVLNYTFYKTKCVPWYMSQGTQILLHIFFITIIYFCTETVTVVVEKVWFNEFTLRQAVQYNVSRSTLYRRLKIYRESARGEFNNITSNAVKKVFREEGIELNSYLKQCTNMYYGLFLGKRLAHNYATANINHSRPEDITKKVGTVFS